jgi:hypothetical protein
VEWSRWRVREWREGQWERVVRRAGRRSQVWKVRFWRVG